MSKKDEEILNAIEYSMFMYPSVDGVLDDFKYDSVKGYVCEIVDNELYNRVGMSRLTKDQVDQTIKDVIIYYTSKGLTSIGWNLSPQSTPENLVEKLENHGFEKATPQIGMARPMSEELNIEVTDEFIFEEYEDEEGANLYKNLEVQEILEKSFGLQEGGASIFGMISDSFRNIDFKMYIAYDKENNKPVAYSTMSTVPDTKIVILNGAATLPEYRKRGLYSSMLKLRFETAKSKGMEYLIIQAMENTSAPIAKKNGFKQLCVLPSYVWKEKSNM